MLEPGGFVLGTVADADFLVAFAVVINDFMNRTGCSKQWWNQTIVSGTSVYAEPAATLRVEHVLVGGIYIGRTTREELDAKTPGWAAEQDVPYRWHEDGLAVGQLQLYPAPNYTGASLGAGTAGEPNPLNRDLTTIGAQRPSGTSYQLSDPIPSIVPNSAVPYLAWGVLAKLFSNDDENKDLARASYCSARFEEGVALFRSIMNEAILDTAEEVF